MTYAYNALHAFTHIIATTTIKITVFRWINNFFFNFASNEKNCFRCAFFILNNLTAQRLRTFSCIANDNITVDQVWWKNKMTKNHDWNISYKGMGMANLLSASKPSACDESKMKLRVNANAKSRKTNKSKDQQQNQWNVVIFICSWYLFLMLYYLFFSFFLFRLIPVQKHFFLYFANERIKRNGEIRPKKYRIRTYKIFAVLLILIYAYFCFVSSIIEMEISAVFVS